MHSVISQLRSNILRVRTLGGLYEAISGLTTPLLDASDLLRAQIVMAVSALDHYVHELTLQGMLEVFNGVRPPTDSYLRFQVPMASTVTAMSSVGGHSWLEALIRERHGYLSFQHPDKIANAIRLFSSCDLWPSVAAQLGTTVHDVKARLRLIVERRNKIAHEADLDPSYPGVRWPISPSDVNGVVNYIESICENIHSLVT